jgi:hypothetical protein
VFVLFLVSLFVLSDYSATYLRSKTVTVAGMDNAYLRRALVLGTVEARKNALLHFEKLVSGRLFSGSGYAASTWVSGKFDEDEDLRNDIVSLTSHNAVLELLWYVGVPGLILFTMVFYEVSRCGFVAVTRASRGKRKSLVVLCAYVVGMFVSGLGNGGVFLGFYFFFFCGTLAAQGMPPQCRGEGVGVVPKVAEAAG